MFHPYLPGLDGPAPPNAPERKDDLVGTRALKERGWTEAAIRRFLGEADKLVPNPAYRSAAPARLYRLDRVTAAEETDAWRTWRAKAIERSERSRKVADRRRIDLLAEVARIPVQIPILNWKHLAMTAVEHRNIRDADRAWDRDWEPDPADVNSVDDATLHRWCVNYLRHQHTSYDGDLNDLYARVGRVEAASLIRRRACMAIGEAYPVLAREAARQAAGLDR